MAAHRHGRVSVRRKESRHYLSNTFFTSPTFFSIFPATFSAVPRSCKSGLPTAFPATSFTFPVASLAVPSALSCVLEFMLLIRFCPRLRICRGNSAGRDCHRTGDLTSQSSERPYLLPREFPYSQCPTKV